MARLTDKQKCFVEHAIRMFGKGLTLGEIYIRAYRLAFSDAKGSDEAIRANAYQKLRLPHVKAYFDALKQQRRDIVALDAEAIGATDRDALTVLGQIMQNAKSDTDTKIKVARIILDYHMRKTDNSADGLVVKIIDDFSGIDGAADG